LVEWFKQKKKPGHTNAKKYILWFGSKNRRHEQGVMKKVSAVALIRTGHDSNLNQQKDSISPAVIKMPA